MRSHKLTQRAQGFSLIELLIVISIIGILAAVAIPKLQEYLRHGRETAAIQSLQEIHRAQASYNSRKNKFTSLDELVKENLLSKNYGEGKTISGYTYTTTDVTANSFTVHADRATTGSGSRDFNVTEDGEVYYIENKSANGTVPRGGGQLLTEAEDSSKEKPAETK